MLVLMKALPTRTEEDAILGEKGIRVLREKGDLGFLEREMELAHGLALIERVVLALHFSRRDRNRGGGAAIDEWSIKEWVRGAVRRCIGCELGERDLVRAPSPCNNDVGCSSCWQVLIWNPQLQHLEKSLLQTLQGAELNVGGVRLQCSAVIQAEPEADHHPKGSRTLAIEGLPCRWFTTEPQSSSQTSVARSVFAKFGSVKNVDVVPGGDDQLRCTIWVQYEKSSSFLDALKALGGCAMQKAGSSLKANYKLRTDARDDYFEETNVRKRRFAREAAARRAEAQRAALEARRAAEEAARKAKLEAEERARRDEEERRATEEQEKLLIEEQHRREEEALKEQERLRLEEEEERRKLELEAMLRREEVERRDQEIREATRKLQEEQRRQLELKRQQEEKDEQLKRQQQQQHEHGEEEDRGRWQLYLDEDGTPWPARVHFSSSTGTKSNRICSKIVTENSKFDP